MILSEYEAKRMELDRKMEDLNERQAEHMMQLASRFQFENKKIGMQMGNLKKNARNCSRSTSRTSNMSINSTRRRNRKCAHGCTPSAWSI